MDSSVPTPPYPSLTFGSGNGITLVGSFCYKQYIFYFRLSIFPLTYDGSFASLILPAIALGWNSAGEHARKL